MLERLLIQNFQAHSKLRVDFAPGITCIVGPSDVGKSAIIRALRWVTTNQPGGGAFVRLGSSGATVQLVVDGHTVTRRRSSSGDVNEYRLDDNEYRAFGRDVPEPVAKLLNTQPVCWQGQHDAPYWFANTPGEVSRELNAIVNLGIIDDALAGVARTVSKARTRLEVAEEELTAAKQEHTALDWVPGFVAAVGVLTTTETACVELANKAAGVAAAVKEAITHQTTCERMAAAAEIGGAAVVAGSTALEMQKQATVLAELLGQADTFMKRLAVTVPDTKNVEAAYNEYHKTNDKLEDIYDIISEAKSSESKLCQTEKEMKRAEALVPKVCPTCGQSL